MRYLVLSLDQEHTKTLILMSDKKDAIDDFTTTNFQNSDEIRSYYKEQINNFLERNKDYIEKVEKETNKKFNGRIVILEYQINNETELNIVEKRVLYKHYNLVVDEALKHKYVMRTSVAFDNKTKQGLYSEFIRREIYRYNYGETKQSINELNRYIKNSKNSYDLSRLIISAYMECRKAKNSLKTQLAIYKDYLEYKNKMLEEKKAKEQQLKDFSKRFDPYFNNDECIYINGFKYKPEEVDLENIKNDDVSGLIPDAIKFNLKPRNDK